MSTNIHVLQTSILLKYQPLFGFLQRHAPPVALEVDLARSVPGRLGTAGGTGGGADVLSVERRGGGGGGAFFAGAADADVESDDSDVVPRRTGMGGGAAGEGARGEAGFGRPVT